MDRYSRKNKCTHTLWIILNKYITQIGAKWQYIYTFWRRMRKICFQGTKCGAAKRGDGGWGLNHCFVDFYCAYWVYYNTHSPQSLYAVASLLSTSSLPNFLRYWKQVRSPGIPEQSCRCDGRMWESEKRSERRGKQLRLYLKHCYDFLICLFLTSLIGGLHKTNISSYVCATGIRYLVFNTI